MLAVVGVEYCNCMIDGDMPIVGPHCCSTPLCVFGACYSLLPVQCQICCSDQQQLDVFLAHVGHTLLVAVSGWTYRKSGTQVWRQGAVAVYGVPYSEHSSWTDLRACVSALRPKRIVPTVNCPTPAQSRAIVDRFADLMDLSCDKSRLDVYFKAGTDAHTQSSGLHTTIVQQDGDDTKCEVRLSLTGSQPHCTSVCGEHQQYHLKSKPSVDVDETKVDIADIDMAEQQRIWDSLKRSQQLQQSLEYRAAHQPKKRRKMLASDVHGKVLASSQPAQTSKVGSKSSSAAAIDSKGSGCSSVTIVAGTSSATRSSLDDGLSCPINTADSSLVLQQPQLQAPAAGLSTIQSSPMTKSVQYVQGTIKSFLTLFKP